MVIQIVWSYDNKKISHLKRGLSHVRLTIKRNFTLDFDKGYVFNCKSWQHNWGITSMDSGDFWKRFSQVYFWDSSARETPVIFKPTKNSGIFMEKSRKKEAYDTLSFCVSQFKKIGTLWIRKR